MDSIGASTAKVTPQTGLHLNWPKDNDAKMSETPIPVIQDMLDAIPQMACIWHVDHRIRYANAEWTGFFGDLRSDWIGHIYLDDLADVNALIASQSVDRPKRQLECRIRDAAGMHRWFSLSARALAQPADSFGTIMMITAFPIHDYKLQEQVLYDSAIMRKNMLNASVDCIKVVTPAGLLKDMNKAGCRALGVAEQSDFGMPWLGLLPPEIRGIGETALETARRGETGRFTGLSQIPGQPPQYWDNLLTPVVDASGEVIEIACVSRDVTDEKLKEQQLRVVKEGLELAAQAAGLGSFEIRPQEDRFSWDERCGDLLGHAGQDAHDFAADFLGSIHISDRDATAEAIRAAMQIGGPGCFACEFRTSDGAGQPNRYVLANGVTLFDDGKPWRMIGTVQDVTSDRNVRKSLNEAREKLKSALDIEQILTREMHHRVKNLFTVVSGLVAIADREVQTTDDAEKALQNLRDRVLSMARVTDLVIKPHMHGDASPAVDPSAVTRSALAPYMGRFHVEDAESNVDRQMLSPLVLLTHELATNSLKYGALSQMSGTIGVSWQQSETTVSLIWTETGGPEIKTAPQHQGFGSEMLHDVVTLSGGTLELDWRRSGLVVVATFPRV